MKKFYKEAAFGPAPGGFVVRLDGKPIKTMMQRVLLLPSPALAAEIANEWQAQEDKIVPASMPLMQLASTMLDKAEGPDRAAMNVELLRYGASDLVCYHATHPEKLVKLHEEHWQPLLGWLADAHGVALQKVAGIQYLNQPPESLEKLKTLIDGLGPEDFTVVQSATAVTGSLVIALALLDGYLDAEQAHAAACVDEAFQLEQWGEDEEARKRLTHIREELDNIMRFRDLLRAQA
ncbi:MAG: ATPase [Alphaproteobacteria bacterium]|nr:ATPase [Alphaproteobacteria bacterium]